MIKGWVVMTDTVCDGLIIGDTTEALDKDGNPFLMPTVYISESDAWKSIVEDHIEHLQQFINDKRALNEIDINIDDFAAYVEIKNETISIWMHDECLDKAPSLVNPIKWVTDTH